MVFLFFRTGPRAKEGGGKEKDRHVSHPGFFLLSLYHSFPVCLRTWAWWESKTWEIDSQANEFLILNIRRRHTVSWILKAGREGRNESRRYVDKNNKKVYCESIDQGKCSGVFNLSSPTLTKTKHKKEKEERRGWYRSPSSSLMLSRLPSHHRLPSFLRWRARLIFQLRFCLLLYSTNH